MLNTTSPFCYYETQNFISLCDITAEREEVNCMVDGLQIKYQIIKCMGNVDQASHRITSHNRNFNLLRNWGHSSVTGLLQGQSV